MPASHARISQALDKWNVRFEVLNLQFHFHRHLLASGDLPEMLNTLEDCLEGVVNILFQLFCVYGGEGIVHPTVIPLQPVRCCQPHVLKRLKVLDQPSQLVILFSTDQN